MPAFPLTALFLFNGIFVLGSTLVLVWLFRRRQDISANFWIGAGTFSTAAATLTAFKPDLPPFLGHLLPNMMQVMHQFFLGFAFLALSGVKVPQRWVLASLGLVLLFGMGLHWVSADSPRVWQVPYVSFVHGMLALGISSLIQRQIKQNPTLRYLIFPQLVLLTLALLWLLRLPLSAAGMALHTGDPGLGNWLLFVSLLTMNIVLHFSYFAVRLSESTENRMQLVEVNLRLRTLVSAHEDLTPQIDSGLAALPNLPAQSLSAQIAHELNQPLATLRLKLETLMSFPAVSLNDGNMKSMLADIERISATVRGLQHLMRGQSLNIMHHDLGRIFDNTLSPLPGVETVSPMGALPVMVDAPLIAKALKSLVQWLQAYAAPSSNGSCANTAVIATCGASQDGLVAHIWLSASGVDLDQNLITLLNSEKVLDPIGHAMPHHDLHQLIDALMVQHVMRAQRGRISVESRQDGSGTVLMLSIPMAVRTTVILPAAA